MVYKNLRVEMLKANLSVAKLAKMIGVAEKTLRNKLNGETDFTWTEAKAIRNIVNKNMSIEELFEKSEEPENAEA